MSINDDRVDELVSNQTPGAGEMDLDYDMGASTSVYEEPGDKAYDETAEDSYQDPLDEVFDDEGNLRPASDL